MELGLSAVLVAYVFRSKVFDIGHLKGFALSNFKSAIGVSLVCIKWFLVKPFWALAPLFVNVHVLECFRCLGIYFNIWVPMTKFESRPHFLVEIV